MIRGIWIVVAAFALGVAGANLTVADNCGEHPVTYSASITYSGLQNCEWRHLVGDEWVTDTWTCPTKKTVFPPHINCEAGGPWEDKCVSTGVVSEVDWTIICGTTNQCPTSTATLTGVQGTANAWTTGCTVNCEGG